MESFSVKAGKFIKKNRLKTLPISAHDPESANTLAKDKVGQHANIESSKETRLKVMNFVNERGLNQQSDEFC